MISYRAVKDAILPLSTPIEGRDGKLMHEVFVPKGTSVVISILASNRNRALWGPAADEWKPERWLKPLPKTVENANIPGVYSNMWVIRPVFSMAYSNALSSSRMTFVGGGRSCM